MVRAMRILTGGLLMGILFAVCGPVAQAADSCDTVVADATNAQVLGDQTKIVAEAERLASLGADVRIRAFDSAPGGNFDTYLREQIASCPSWAGAGGDVTKPNLIAFLFSMDHQSAIFYGSNWHSAMDSNVDRIRADHMNAQFKAGDFVAGIVNAEAETFRVMDNQLHPAQSNGGTSSGTSSNAPPQDYSGFWRVVFIALGCCLLGLLMVLIGGWVYRVYRGRQLLIREHRQAYGRATAAKTAASRAVTTLVTLDDPQNETDVSVQILIGQLNAQDGGKLKTQFDEAKRAVREALIKNSRFVGDSVGSEVDSKLTTEALDATTAQYEQIAEGADQAILLYQQMEAVYTDLYEQVGHASQTLGDITAKLSAAQALNKQLIQQGFKTHADTELADAEAVLAAAQSQIKAGKPGQALDELQDLEGRCESLQDSLKAISARRDTLVARQAKLNSLLAASEPAVQTAHKQMAMLGDIYNASCSAGLQRGNGDMDGDLDKARAASVDANASLSMQSQQWDRAEKALDKMEQYLDKCNALCEAISSRTEQLARLSSSQSGDVAQLVQAIAAAKTTVNGMRGEQRKQVSALDDLSQKAIVLQGSLGRNKPDLLEIQAEIEKIVSQKNSILKDAEKIENRIITEERQRAEEEERQRREARRRREEKEEEDRRSSSSSAIAFGAGYLSGGGSSSSSDYGGGSSGSWGGGDSGGGSSGSW